MSSFSARAPRASPPLPLSMCTRSAALRRAGLAIVVCVLWATATTAFAQGPAIGGLLQELPDKAGLRATVFGPDPESLYELPDNVPLREINLRIDGAQPIPDLFWFNRELRVWFSQQKKAAPLVVVLPGTGGSGNTAKLGVLRAALYGAGYHVLTLPSPTFPGFVVAASSTGVAGDLHQDAADLRRALHQILAALPRSTEITALHAVGYSLGGAHAAMLKALDDSSEPLGIHRVVMINPPVSLFASVNRLDRLFAESIGNDDAAIEAFYQRLYAELAMLYRNSGALVLDEGFLLRAAARLLQTDEEFAAAIALSFRITLVDMFFAGDYYARSGVVVDPNDPPEVGDPLESTLRELRTKPFSEYFNEVFAPYYLARRPRWTRDDLIASSSLASVETPLKRDDDYYGQATVDDIILDAAELDWLRETLKSRIAVYDHGGHLGNIGEREQIEDMLKMLAGGWQAPAEEAP